MLFLTKGEEMKDYQQLGFEVNDNNSKGNYIPKIQISLVKKFMSQIRLLVVLRQLLKVKL
jgi:hypothetical protein